MQQRQFAVEARLDRLNGYRRGGQVPDGKEESLDEAYEEMERELPPRAARALRWLRNPEARWIRLPLGLALIAASFMWFLPVVGIELLPLGLLLLAQDVPFLRAPVARFTIWLVRRWMSFKQRWTARGR